jgi:hypothetical protein
MQTQLRPLSLGEILDRTAELYRRNFVLFAGIAAIFSGMMLAVQLLHLLVLHLSGFPNIPPQLAWVTSVSAVVQILVIVLIAGLSIAATTRAVAWVYLDHPATIASAVRSVMPRKVRYIWLMTLSFFSAWGPMAVVYIAGAIIVLRTLPHGYFTNPAIARQTAQNPAAMGAFLAGILILLPFFIAAGVYGVWMSLRLSLGVPASVVEELPAWRALKRSTELSKGSKGRIFVLGLLVYAVDLILAMVLSIPFIFAVFRHSGQVSLAMLSWQQVASFITDTLIGPIYATGLTLFYYDQRIRKEGFDIEWMMRAAGLGVSSAAGLPEPAQAATTNSI